MSYALSDENIASPKDSILLNNVIIINYWYLNLLLAVDKLEVTVTDGEKNIQENHAIKDLIQKFITQCRFLVKQFMTLVPKYR